MDDEIVNGSFEPMALCSRSGVFRGERNDSLQLKNAGFRGKPILRAQVPAAWVCGPIHLAHHPGLPGSKDAGDTGLLIKAQGFPEDSALRIQHVEIPKVTAEVEREGIAPVIGDHHVQTFQPLALPHFGGCHQPQGDPAAEVGRFRGGRCRCNL